MTPIRKRPELVGVFDAALDATVGLVAAWAVDTFLTRLERTGQYDEAMPSLRTAAQAIDWLDQ